MINRILIVGYGSIGKRHLCLARELFPNADIRVMRHKECSSVPEKADGCFFLIEQAIVFFPQIAIIANPASNHLKVAIPLAEQGVHLFIEKPLSVSCDGVIQLIEVCREKKTVLLTGYNLRFLKSLGKYRELLRERLIGRVISVRCEIGQYLPSWRPESDYRQGVSALRSMGGGALLELSHEIDYIRWIFGDVDWVRAILSKQSSLEIDVEDTCHLIIGFMQGDDGYQLIGALNMDFVRHDTTRLCTAIGEYGSLRWNGLTGVIEKFEMGSEKWIEVYHHPHQRNDSYIAEWKHFIDCVHGKAVPLITGEDGFKVLQIIDAARKSSECGEQVQINQSALKKEKA